MKLLCIKQDEWTIVRYGAGPYPGGPKYGDIVTSVGETDRAYLIEEYDAYYSKRHFIPCSGIDETELVNLKEETMSKKKLLNSNKNNIQ